MKKEFAANRAFRSDLRTTGHASEEARQLYFALMRLGVVAELEMFDGFQIIDIAIPASKINITVDGSHQHYNPLQAISDLKRTICSFKKGYLTLSIPNSLVKTDLEETALAIKEFITDSCDQKFIA